MIRKWDGHFPSARVRHFPSERELGWEAEGRGGWLDPWVRRQGSGRWRARGASVSG